MFFPRTPGRRQPHYHRPSCELCDPTEPLTSAPCSDLMTQSLFADRGLTWTRIANQGLGGVSSIKTPHELSRRVLNLPLQPGVSQTENIQRRTQIFLSLPFDIRAGSLFINVWQTKPCLTEVFYFYRVPGRSWGCSSRYFEVLTFSSVCGWCTIPGIDLILGVRWVGLWSCLLTWWTKLVTYYLELKVLFFIIFFKGRYFYKSTAWME